VYLVNLVEMDFLGVPRPKRGGSGYPLYPASPISIGLPGCRFYPSRGASRSKQGTKIEEMGFWGRIILKIRKEYFLQGKNNRG